MIDLTKIAGAVGRTGDGAFDHVRLDFALGGGDFAAIREVPIAPFEEEFFKEVMPFVAPRACYHNVCVCLKALSAADRQSARYVLGYWSHGFPVEHCFLKIGDKYHDPTFEAFFRDSRTVRNFRAVELAWDEIAQISDFMFRRHRSRDHIGIREYHRYIRSKGPVSSEADATYTLSRAL